MKQWNKNTSRMFLFLLIFMNLVVLIGQLWPKGAPPFARIVNVVFLILALVYFSLALLKLKE
ncbi:MAG: hypothetical protein K0B15_01685 [Lentimicrobium sp.]|nr:hypothetical protein [Lentimicrobium sp.]